MLHRRPRLHEYSSTNSWFLKANSSLIHCFCIYANSSVFQSTKAWRLSFLTPTNTIPSTPSTYFLNLSSLFGYFEVILGSVKFQLHFQPSAKEVPWNKLDKRPVPATSYSPLFDMVLLRLLCFVNLINRSHQFYLFSLFPNCRFVLPILLTNGHLNETEATLSLWKRHQGYKMPNVPVTWKLLCRRRYALFL